jgi:PAS domain S-box-containing protein
MTNIIQDYNLTRIREKAEELAGQKHEDPDEEGRDGDKQRLYHELEVHQIELELQNEELIQSREEAIKAAQKYTELYETAPVNFFTLDSKSKILELNVFASQLLEKKKDDLINSYFTSFVHRDDQYIFDSFIENVFNNQAQSKCEIRLKPSKTQGPVYVILTAILAQHRDNCFLTAIDITEQKRALQSILENHRLGAIGEMATSIAHDFNNALQSLLGNLELALHVKENSRHLKVMKTLIIDAAARVHQLQRVSGKNSANDQFSYLDLTSLVKDTIAQTRPLWKDEAEAKGLCFQIYCEASEELGIYGDRGELRAALFNIIKNSIEAMPAGGTITIKMSADDHHTFLTLTDTGIGMDEETKMRIFQPFYSTKDLNPGRGMGMSGVLSVIKEHKGEVWVKSTSPGQGTTIEIKLPVYRREKDLEVSNKGKNPFKPQRKSLNLLWVDDDDDIRMFAEEAIKIMGHNVTMAESGKQALHLLEKENYDLVVTDIGMPEMNGWQLADKIKEKPGDIKVAVASGWGDQIKERELYEHGVKYMLNKPFKLSQLNDLFENLG